MRPLTRSLEGSPARSHHERGRQAAGNSEPLSRTFSSLHIPAQRLWSALTGLFYLAIAGGVLTFGLSQTGFFERAGKLAFTYADDIAYAAGLRLRDITITGHSKLEERRIIKALAPRGTRSILGYSTKDAQKRLEGIGWVKRVEVMRFLPASLSVVIEEREPFALWQSEGQIYLIDAEGAVIGAVQTDDYPGLALFVGRGAAVEAAALSRALAAHPQLKADLLAAVRVAERRWNLKLRDGTDILLPDGKTALVVAEFAELDAQYDLLRRDLAMIDLRLGDRLTIRPRLRESVGGAISRVTTTSAGGALGRGD